MIYFAFATSLVLLVILRQGRRRMQIEKQTQKFSFLLIDNAVKFLRPFMVVTLFYLVLTIFLNGSSETTIGVLREYERWLNKVQNLLKYLKLTPALSLLVLVVAFAATLVADAFATLRPYKERIEQYHSFVEKYHKWIGRVATVITLLGCFTFFGGTVSRAHGRLELKITDMRTKGEELRNAVEEELSKTTAANVMHALPSTAMNFKPVSALYEEIDRKYKELVREKEASSKYKIESRAAEETLADFQSSNVRIESFSTPARTAEASQETRARKYESSISKSKLNRLQHELEEYVGQSARLAKEKFETPLGSRIGTSVLKILISERHIPVLNALTTAIPIAGPLLSIITDSITTKASMLIGSTTDSIIAAAVDNNPPALQDSIETSAKNVSAAVLKDISANNTPISGVEETLARSNLAKLDAAEKELHTRLENEKGAFRELNRVLLKNLRASLVTTQAEPSHETGVWPRLRLPDSRLGLGDFPQLPGEEMIDATKRVSEQQSKFIVAVERLIDQSEKIDDPLKQNEILIAITTTVSSDKSLEIKAASLGKLAGLQLNDEVVKKSFNEIGGQSNAVAGREWASGRLNKDHLGRETERRPEPIHERAGFERKVDPIHLVPEFHPRPGRP
jgi:hypothetical protein